MNNFNNDIKRGSIELIVNSEQSVSTICNDILGYLKTHEVTAGQHLNNYLGSCIRQNVNPITGSVFFYLEMDIKDFEMDNKEPKPTPTPKPKPRKVKITAISDFIECETTLPQSKANKLIKALTKANNELNTTGTQGIKITIETVC